jgi:hypothetical protein
VFFKLYPIVYQWDRLHTRKANLATGPPPLTASHISTLMKPRSFSMGSVPSRHQVVDFVTNKVLGIDVNERFAHQPADLQRRAYQLLEPADVYLEQEPTVSEWVRELAPTRAAAVDYIQSLFPSSSWVLRYCARWLLGDFIAGKL